MSKNKSKKDKKPNIPVQTLARPRLEQILLRRQHDELDEEEFITSIQNLAGEVGREAVLQTLLGLLDKSSNEQKDALMLAIPKLGNADTIKYLWQLVRRSKASITTKMTALVILQQMGEQVNLDDPSEYFSWRDVKQADLTEVENMAHFGMRALIKEIQRAKDTDELENMMLQMERIHAQSGGEAVALAEIESLIEMGDSGAADMLLAISATTPRPKVREAARKGLLKLAGQKVFPQAEVVKSLTNERFYAAYSTDPAHPWQQGVIIAFERSKNNIQALVFLRDFGSPWKGAIKDVFPTHILTPQQLQREFLDRSRRQDVNYKPVTYARARQFILDALKANEHNRVKLPKEFEEFRHLVERRVVDPSPEVLAHAAQIDANTVDGWGELSGEPVRGMEIIGPDGQPMPVIIPEDFYTEEDEDEEYTLDDLLDEVDKYYAEDEDESAGELIINDEGFLVPYEWAAEYLEDRFEEGIELDELEERWMDLCDFMYYADTHEAAPTELAEVQGFHLSEFVTEFWDKEIDEESPLEEKQHTIETIHDLYAYLADQGHISGEVSARVAQAAATLLSQPDQLTPIPR